MRGCADILDYRSTNCRLRWNFTSATVCSHLLCGSFASHALAAALSSKRIRSRFIHRVTLVDCEQREDACRLRDRSCSVIVTVLTITRRVTWFLQSFCNSLYTLVFNNFIRPFSVIKVLDSVELRYHDITRQRIHIDTIPCKKNSTFCRHMLMICWWGCQSIL